MNSCQSTSSTSYSRYKSIVAFLAFSISATAEAFSVQKNQNVNSIHRIVFGTAALSKADDPHAMLDAAFDKGVRRFDLARTYGMGASERIFGEWLVSRNIDRRDIDLITKGGIGMDGYGDPDRPLLTKNDLLSEVHDSLSTLNVEDVDLYMFHRDDARLGVDKFVDWINAIVKTGKVKRWGVSNWSFERFQAAYEYATEKGLVPPSANSPQFSLAAPACDVWPSTQSISQPHHLTDIDWYAERGIELLCWEGTSYLCIFLYDCGDQQALITSLLSYQPKYLQKVSWRRKISGRRMKLILRLLTYQSREDLTNGASSVSKKPTAMLKTTGDVTWPSNLLRRVTSD